MVETKKTRATRVRTVLVFIDTLKETWGIMVQVDGDKVSLVMVQIGDQVYFD